MTNRLDETCLTREHLLAIRETPLPPRSNSRRHSGAIATKFQVVPVPLAGDTDRRWHRVYRNARGLFIEARSVKMRNAPRASSFLNKEARGCVRRITADLDRWLAEVEKCRLGEFRYLQRSELLSLHQSLPSKHDGNPHRIPTGLWVLWRPADKVPPRNRGRNQHTGPATPNTALDPYWGSTWHEVYRTTQGGWLYIEVGTPIFTDEERAQRKTGCPVEETKLRRYQGVVRIAPETLACLARQGRLKPPTCNGSCAACDGRCYGSAS